MAILSKVAGLLTAIGLLAGFTIGWARQPTGEQIITVCPQGPPICQFSKIQEVLKTAADGATVLISPGTYIEREKLRISKNLRLLGPESRLVRLITDRISIEESAQVMIQGLTIQGRTIVYGAQATLAHVDVIGTISVGPQEETEHPKKSRIVLINVRVLAGASVIPSALTIGPAAEVVVTDSEFVADFGEVVGVLGAQLVMSHSLIRVTTGLAHGLLVGSGAKVWLSDTQIEIYSPFTGSLDIRRGGGNVGMVAFEGSDTVLQRVAIFSIHHGVLAQNARLHMENSQVVAVNGWGLALMIEACGINIPLNNPPPKTYEGLITGRNNEIPDKNESGGLGDVCPPELKFLKTPQGGQYP